MYDLVLPYGQLIWLTIIIVTIVIVMYSICMTIVIVMYSICMRFKKIKLEDEMDGLE